MNHRQKAIRSAIEELERMTDREKRCLSGIERHDRFAQGRLDVFQAALEAVQAKFTITIDQPTDQRRDGDE